MPEVSPPASPPPPAPRAAGTASATQNAVDSEAQALEFVSGAVQSLGRDLHEQIRQLADNLRHTCAAERDAAMSEARAHWNAELKERLAREAERAYADA